MADICPECGADQPLDAVHCGVCGALMNPQEEPSAQLEGEEIFNYSLFVVALVLLTIGIPRLIGLSCFFLGR